MRFRDLAPALLALAAGGAFAQLAADNPDWRENDAPPPPAFELSRLVPFEVSASSSLAFGVDAGTIRIGGDGVVRYVVVARSKSGGATNTMYEGIRCATGEFKTYARYNEGSGWTPVSAPEWQSMYKAVRPRYALELARQGVCAENAPPPSVQHILRDLRNQNEQKRG
ncbi:CNP1-like family protein [Variovorax terrae]|uniref:CNP1-like family protein n=1 Tax=Variovorax terrae TaxID=2923278 RepID=A0A9X1VWH4_9BURK|nr:CNP1-like family protein [Variovorax terrae]MCJ0765056.1 CNP1-like family protein [Variovorax terrae]